MSIYLYSILAVFSTRFNISSSTMVVKFISEMTGLTVVLVEVREIQSKKDCKVTFQEKIQRWTFYDTFETLIWPRLWKITSFFWLEKCWFLWVSSLLMLNKKCARYSLKKPKKKNLISIFINTWPNKSFEGTVVNRALPTLHEVFLEFTLTVPLRKLKKKIISNCKWKWRKKTSSTTLFFNIFSCNLLSLYQFHVFSRSLLLSMDISVWRLKRTIMMDYRTLLNISSSLVGSINQANVKIKIESISFLYLFIKF